MRTRGWAFVLASSVSGAACLTAQAPTRLYPAREPLLTPVQVSTLTGFVQYVDDKDVSALTGTFELLPGCHVIRTPAHWGVDQLGGNTVTANTGHWVFAVPMKPGHQYRIGVVVSELVAPVGTLTIKAYETDLEGKETGVYEHTRDFNTIRDCYEDAARVLRDGPSF